MVRENKIHVLFLWTHLSGNQISGLTASIVSWGLSATSTYIT